MAERHKWTEEDDTVAFYLYRFTDRHLPLSLDDIGQKLGMGAGSLRLRIGAYLALDKGEGTAQASRQCREVYERHKGLAQEELKALVVRIMGWK